jgi:hypothetical protein
MTELVTKGHDGRLPREAVGTALRDLDWSMKTGKLHPNSFDHLIRQLNKATSDEQFKQYYAEVRAARDVIESGDLAPGTKVVANAHGGSISDDLGDGTRIDIHPVPQADLLYKASDGKIHIEEVMGTPNALKGKLIEKKQLARLFRWLDADRNGRFIGYRMPNEDIWTGLFHGKRDTLQMVIERKMPLTIGNKTYSVKQLKSIHGAVAKKYFEWKRANPEVDDSVFFAQPEMGSVESAMRFINGE